jgi:hypothetical protein
MSYVPSEQIEWGDEAASHIRNRSGRYPENTNIHPAWTVEVVNDPQRLVDEPDPKSRHANSVRTTGYSHTAGIVITVVALRDAHGVQHGATAWRTRGAALRQYREQEHGLEREHEDGRNDDDDRSD